MYQNYQKLGYFIGCMSEKNVIVYNFKMQNRLNPYKLL